MYNNYRHSYTIKVLVVVAPNGVITYVSAAYPGLTSDKAVVENCGILKDMRPGDLILADKGFLLQDLVSKDVSVNIPPFLCTVQFSVPEVEETRTIAKARIHVERAICRLKCYRILNFLTRKMYLLASVIIQICAALTNFRSPLIKEVGPLYEAIKAMIKAVNFDQDNRILPEDENSTDMEEVLPIEEIDLDVDEFLPDLY